MSEAAAATADTGQGGAPESGDPNYESPTLARGGTADGATGDATGDGGTTGEGDGEGTTATEEPAGKGKRSLVSDLQAERAKVRERDEFINAWRPILERLDGRPDLQEAVLHGKVTIAQADAIKQGDDDAELRDIAEDLGYYKRKADGTPDFDQPDLERAKKYRTRHQKWAKDAAEPLVQPLARQTASQQAMSRIDQAVAYCTQHQHADPDFVRGEFLKIAQADPARLLSDRDGNALYELIVGRALLQGRAFKGGSTRTATEETGDRSVVITEPAGGRRGTAPRLTPAERALGEAHGLTDKDWQRAEAHVGLRRGYSTLED